MYTRVGARVNTHVSLFEWEPLYGIITQRKPTFVGTLVYTCVSTCGSPFVGALVGSISLSPALCFTDLRVIFFRKDCSKIGSNKLNLMC